MADLGALRQFIVKHYSLEELRTLCFDLGVRYDALEGAGSEAKAREFLLYLGRHYRFDTLLHNLELTKPQAFQQAGLSNDTAVVTRLYDTLPVYDHPAPPADHRQPTQRSPAQMGLLVLAVLSWVVAVVWFIVEPGFEPLLGVISGLAFFLGSFAVDRIDKAETSGPGLRARNRRISRGLVEKVRTIWVRDVLEKNLHEMALLELGLAEKPGAVVRPWSMAIERPNQEERDLPAGANISDIFRELGGGMLILGQPGSGKTITLLTLAEQMLNEAGKGGERPIPLVFNLSSWALKRQSLIEWLAGELNLVYGVGSKYAQDWLTSASYALLLDGLDEVEAQHRDDCVQAINTFHQEHGQTPVAVCSRIEDYEQLTERLRLMGAIVIRPLTAEQVDEYLAAGGEQLAAARTAVQHDDRLAQMAQTPLMLNIIALAYRERPPVELESGTLEQRRQHLFAAYVERMFERRGAAPGQDQNQAIRYLSTLANGMQERTQSVFYVERLQPDWLPEKNQKRNYRLMLRLAFSLVYGLLISIVVVPGVGVIVGLTRGPVIGVLTGLAAGLASILIIGLITQPVINFEEFLSVKIQKWPWMANSIFGRRGNFGDIKPIESLKWSWRDGLLVGLITFPIAGILVGTLTGLIIGLLDSFEVGVVFGLFGCILGGPILGLLMGLGFGFKSEELQMRTSPNQGIYATRKNSLRIGLLFGLLAGLLFGFFGLLGGPLTGLVGILSFGLLFGTIGGFSTGGQILIYHYVLRRALARYRRLPYNIVPFLDEMAGRIILRKVGGGYMFIHRMLLEYFAELESKSLN